MAGLRISSGARATALFSALVWLGACAAPGAPDYVRIKPVYEYRNGPTPVPFPRAKPSDKGRLRQAAVEPAPPRPNEPLEQDPRRDRPAGRVTVLPGDTLAAIARRHDVTAQALIRANALTDPNRLYAGQQLQLPGPMRTHVVRRGETVKAIADSHGLTWRAVARANNLTPPYRLHVGQQLHLPPRAPQVDQRTARAVIPPPLATDFDWPLSGPVLSGFGDKGGGLRNDGINIAAAAGSPIRAAEQGEVVYAGGDLKAFGNLVLIRHADGFISAYAHASRILVDRGARVRRGEIIAHVGQTGHVAEPQLHFELRMGDKAVDPVRYLPRLTAQR